MKNAIIAGASGMIGRLVLDHCLSSPEIASIISLVRRRSGNQHPRLKEVIVEDFSDFSSLSNLFQNIDVAFFCIGAYTGQVPDDKFKEITVDYAVAFATALDMGSPKSNLSFLSGAGADRTEKSRMSFARYKGMAENQISNMGLNFYTFRPGYIYPVTPRKEPGLMYRISRTLYPLIKMMGSNSSIKSTELASAMFHVGLNGAKKEELENRDILQYV